MGKILGIHPLELKPGASEAELERLVREELAPPMQQIGQQFYLMKGDRGAGAGKYMLVVEIKSVAERDRVFGSGERLGQVSDDFTTVLEQSAAGLKKLDALVVAFPSPEFTDYEVLGEQHGSTE